MSPVSTAPRSALRALAILAAVAAPLALSGCFPIDVTNAQRIDGGGASKSDDPIVESDSAGFDELSFEDGALLTSASTAEWADGLMFDDGWTLTSPDDGNGNWGYTSADGACTAAYWQGYIGDVDTSSGDDRIATDEMLAVVFGATAAEVGEVAVDGGFALAAPGNDDVDARYVVGDDGTVQWVVAGRALVQPGLGFTVTIDCTGQDPEAVLDELNELSAIAVVP
ncbi:hypothetical protein M3147_07860 [Agromyces mediolanus]|uniref:hypothetical protein n=1 Tax=Agromyces mediolanus TaxID=41986 RepID=UPI00203A865C|nr:hypothetical protein [Agromyces mediolanus]MCM3657162.1 hypothetical protein [Agromyces mediolanus]